MGSGLGWSPSIPPSSAVESPHCACTSRVRVRARGRVRARARVRVRVGVRARARGRVANLHEQGAYR